MKTGKLFLIPTPLGDNTNIPLLFFQQEIIFGLDVFVVEEISTARRFLKKIGYPRDFHEVEFLVWNEQSTTDDLSSILPYLGDGKSLGLMSEAGLPCVADPGSEIVKIAHEKKMEVIPLPGPSSIFLALMASGAHGQHFTFLGYLPIDKAERARKIREMEKEARLKSCSQIFMETPYRNNQLLEIILKTCREDTLLAVACNLLSNNQFIISKSVRRWKEDGVVDLHKKPAVFVLFTE